jgi:hypothetical protein
MARVALSEREVRTQLRSARRRTERSRRTSPEALAVRFDSADRAVCIQLTNGAQMSLPASLVPGLKGASVRELREVVVGPAGLGLRWERLDLDLSVASLVQLCFGAPLLLRAAGSVGGSACSPAKARAARLNGRKGGRPRTRAGR